MKKKDGFGIYILISLFVIFYTWISFNLNSKYIEINIYLLVTIIETIIIVYFSVKKNMFLKDFFFNFKLIYNLYFILGVIIYELREKILYEYIIFIEGNISLTARILFLCSIIVYIPLIIYKILDKKRNYKSKKVKFRIKEKRIYLVALIFLVFSWIAFFYMSNKFNLIPILSQNKNLVRVQFISNKNPIIYEIYKLSYYASTLILIILIKRVDENKIYNLKNLLYIVTLLISYLPTIAYGSRFFMIFPILLSILVSINLNIKINYKKILVFGVVILIGTVIFSVFRNFSEINGQLLIKIVAMDFFPEYSDFSTMLCVPYDKHEMFKAVIVTGVISLIPGKILSVIGIDKSKYYLLVGDVLLKYFPNAGNILGIRIGMIGELYLAIGGNLIFLVILISYFIIKLNNLNKLSQRFSGKFITCNIAIMTSLAIPYGFSFIASSILTSLFIFIFLRGMEYE